MGNSICVRHPGFPFWMDLAGVQCCALLLLPPWEFVIIITLAVIISLDVLHSCRCVTCT